MTKIFIFVNSRWSTGDVAGCALTEDGRAVASHLSSSVSWLRHDMGIQYSEWKHDEYKAACPEGYELVDLTKLTYEETKAHEGLQAAIAAAKAYAAAEDETEEMAANSHTTGNEDQ